MKRQGHTFPNDPYATERIIHSLARVTDYLNRAVMESDRIGDDLPSLVYADVIRGHEITDNVTYAITIGCKTLHELMHENREGLVLLVRKLQDFKCPDLIEDMQITFDEFLDQEESLLVQSGVNPLVAHGIANQCRTQINTLSQLETSDAQLVIDAFQDLEQKSSEVSFRLRSEYQANLDLLTDGPQLRNFYWGFAGSLLLIISGVEFFNGVLPPDLAAISGGFGEHFLGADGRDITS